MAVGLWPITSGIMRMPWVVSGEEEEEVVVEEGEVFEGGGVMYVAAVYEGVSLGVGMLGCWLCVCLGEGREGR